MLPNERADIGESKIPPKMKLTYTDFKLVFENPPCMVFEARKMHSNEKYMIRILDTSELGDNNDETAFALFTQELYYLDSVQPGAVLLESLEISEDGKLLACVTLPYLPLSLQFDSNIQVVDPTDSKVIRKLISDVFSGIEFLWNKLKIKNTADIIKPENICYMKDKGSFFLSNWFKLCQPETNHDNSDFLDPLLEKSVLSSQDIVNELKAIAFIVLKIKRVNYEEPQGMGSDPKFTSEAYEHELKNKIAGVFDDMRPLQDSTPLQDLIQRMLSLDPQELPRFEELKGLKAEIGKGFKSQDSVIPEETKQARNEATSETEVKTSVNIIGKYYAYFLGFVFGVMQKLF